MIYDIDTGTYIDSRNEEVVEEIIDDNTLKYLS